VPLSSVYPNCPASEVNWVDVLSVDLFAGLQANASLTDFENKAWKDLTTIFGVAEVRPSKMQECAWDIQTPHPAYPGFTEFRADPVSGADCDELYGRPGDPQLPPRN
jgi:hypothetical protein